MHDNNNDNECFILTYELIKLIICNTMINQYSHSEGNYIMTYISLPCHYHGYVIKHLTDFIITNLKIIKQ